MMRNGKSLPPIELEGKFQMAAKNKNSVKLASNLIHLATATHVALFNEILLDQIRTPEGRWFNVRTKDHHLPFLDAQAIVTPEGALPGVQFVARKLNYNFNDSNWVGDSAVLAKLVEVGSKAAGKTLAKKEIYFYLEDIKETMKASKFVPAAPVVEEAPQTEQTEA